MSVRIELLVSQDMSDCLSPFAAKYCILYQRIASLLPVNFCNHRGSSFITLLRAVTSWQIVLVERSEDGDKWRGFVVRPKNNVVERYQWVRTFCNTPQLMELLAHISNAEIAEKFSVFVRCVFPPSVLDTLIEVTTTHTFKRTHLVFLAEPPCICPCGVLSKRPLDMPTKCTL